MTGATTGEEACIGRQPPVAQSAAIHFCWSGAKLRVAGLILGCVAAPAVFGCAASALWLQGLCLTWLLAVAWLMHRLGQRATSDAVVLSIDRCGILDRRLLSRPIGWQEIEGICLVKPDRSQVVDITLRWPEVTLGKTRWLVRIGAYCQRAYGVPAVSINLLLLDGTVSELLKGIAQYRPDLLHAENRPPSQPVFRPKA